jgi:hypothetical protein
MRFNDLVNTILSTPNGSITTQNGTYYYNLHVVVNRFNIKVQKISRPAEDIVSIMLKEQLVEIVSALDNKKIRLKAIGSKK